MRPEAVVVSSENARVVEASTPHARPHGKSPMTETPFISISYDLSTSYISLQPTPSPYSYTPFGIIVTPLPK